MIPAKHCYRDWNITSRKLHRQARSRPAVRSTYAHTASLWNATNIQQHIFIESRTEAEQHMHNSAKRSGTASSLARRRRREPVILDQRRAEGGQDGTGHADEEHAADARGVGVDHLRALERRQRRDDLHVLLDRLHDVAGDVRGVPCDFLHEFVVEDRAADAVEEKSVGVFYSLRRHTRCAGVVDDVRDANGEPDQLGEGAHRRGLGHEVWL